MQTNIRRLLYATVFITGAAVLILEVTAVRVLAPYYGSSIYVLSSVLTVILGALSLGYYVGGKLSDRFESHEPLFAIITIGGLSVLATNLVSTILLPLGSQYFSPATGPLLFGFLFFFLPAFLLGIDSPYVIRLQSRYVIPEYTGSVVGATFFWGTCGSIVGSLSTGFILVPAFGVQHTILSVGVVLILLGVGVSILLSFYTRAQQDITLAMILVARSKYLLTILVTMICLIYLIREYGTPYTNLVVVYEKDALYSKLIVHEMPYNNDTLRILKNDMNYSSATLLNSHDLVFGYTQFAEFYKTLKPDTTQFLLIGGGAYSMPRTLVARDPHIHVDVVEIEPVLFDVAKEYFALDDLSRITNYTVDGRVFFRENNTQYDVIFGDAFNTDYNIPTHLATREFFVAVHDHLKPNGIFMLNYVGTLKHDAPSLTGSFVKTISSVFPNIEIYAFERRSPNQMQNIVFVARKGDESIQLPEDMVIENMRKKWTIKDMRLPHDYFDFDDEMIFTDDKAPVEYLMFKQS